MKPLLGDSFNKLISTCFPSVSLQITRKLCSQSKRPRLIQLGCRKRLTKVCFSKSLSQTYSICSESDRCQVIQIRAER